MATKSRAVPGLRFAGSGNVTWDIGSKGTLTEATTTIEIPGAQVGDLVIVTPNTAAVGFQYSGYVSAASVVTLRATNATTGTVDPASIVASVLVLRP